MEETPGYIPIYRKFFDHYFWSEKREFSKAEAWIDCIGMARYKKNKTKKMIGGRLIKWGYGQFPASIRFLKERWNWGSNGKVERFLKLLEDDEMIETATGQGQIIITLCNYGSYDIKNDTDRTPNGTEAGQRRDRDGTETGQNSKKGNKGKKGNNTPREGEFSEKLKDAESKQELLSLWEQYRRSKNKFMTVFEKDVLLNSEWNGKPVPEIKSAIQHTVSNGWGTLVWPEAEESKAEVIDGGTW